MDICEQFVDAVGNTPLIKLRQASELTGCTILGKAEFANPGGSVKDRAAKYMVLDGELSVTVDGDEVNHLRSGDSFGEIAAIDWGRDFSYGRTATVTATTTTRLLAIPGAALRELMR